MNSRVAISITLIGLVACGTPPAQSQPQAQAQPQASSPPRPAAAASTFGSLDQLLAPVALYPDQLLAQMLMAAATPDKVRELDGWLKANQNLKGTALQDAAVAANFEPSLVALTLFPTVVTQMATQSEWTTLLGQAFAADREAVFATIQKLRHQAQDVGTLKTTPQQEVTERTTSGGDQVIVIEPANPQVVYVPQYNPQVVYTTVPTTVTQTVVVQDTSPDVAIAAGVIGFTAGIAIGAAMDNHYYYGPYGFYGGGYMYHDAWDDYYDAREDAREDWQDHREDLVEERGDRAENRRENTTDRRENTQEQRTDRQQNRQENRPENSQARQQAAQQRQASGQTRQPGQAAQTRAANGASSTAAATGRTGSAQARGYSGGTAGTTRTTPSAGTRSSDAFSGYSSGSSQRASSARGQSSRGSRGGGGGGRRR